MLDAPTAVIEPQLDTLDTPVKLQEAPAVIANELTSVCTWVPVNDLLPEPTAVKLLVVVLLCEPIIALLEPALNARLPVCD